ncbi:putative F-box associated interaction domain-containing protein [Helianthus annuus]|uniref:F-box associated interaction domain-containing protein n=1 Tax=Helianthus annuus TaxID=4232 RepID=A0A9K3EKB8_HELAN|nr:F-box/kelch-repeat protein At3g23880-like [Helianthus annuus]KAF5774614.1 putative F-box associated interaction domain-containing protein [Helianthus annuus]KAJ0477941.1 putative F-box associated interaction domain-containing protein [Helianthus annuus]KAJ0498771.1 putative F-box associated interaction domain-containing protein [Helianthus annuus]KAJ0664791.1 putative F-box associated interaction domain-containing protein [Helianthus annuus]KAJ0672231.1 putative F-box associated interaction
MENIGFQVIVDEIFTRLPAEAIGRLKCLSKNFHRELSSHAFEMMHSLRSGDSLQKKLLSFKDTLIVVDNIVASNFDVVTSKPISFPNNVHHAFLHILSSFNGLLLVCNERICCDLILWNPTTRCYKFLSDDYFNNSHDRTSDTSGMYFDESNDLKVLHIRCYRNVVTARVYSRRRESWRTINFLSVNNYGSSNYSWSPGIYTGKTIYFMVSNYWYPPGERNIVAFDILSETFRMLRFPESIGVNPCQGHFLTIAKRLHVIVVGKSAELTADLLKYEEEEGWIKVFAFNNPRVVD